MITTLLVNNSRTYQIICFNCKKTSHYSTDAHPGGLKATMVRNGWIWYRTSTQCLEASCPKCLPQLVLEAKRVTVEEASVEGLVNVK